MKISVKYKCICYTGGDIFYITKQYDTPTFEKDTGSLEGKFTNSPNIAKLLEQHFYLSDTEDNFINLWVRDLDKTSILADYNCSIIDWEITGLNLSTSNTKRKKVKEDSILEFLNTAGEVSEDLRTTFEAIYTHIHDDIKHMSVKDQIITIKASASVSGKGIINLCQHLLNILNGTEYKDTLLQIE